MDVCLVMIVKNEAERIRRTLESAARFCSRALILDTGSTDGTHAVIREWAGQDYSIPTQIARAIIEPWSYAEARNKALEEARKAWPSCLWCLFLDVDNALEGDPQEFQRAVGDLTGKAADIQIVHAGLTYVQTRLVRNAPNAPRYVGRVHEYLDHVPEGPPVPGIAVRLLDGGPADAERRRARQLRFDLPILLEETIDKPEDCRALFYLAQTLAELGEYRQAEAYYQRRVNAIGWDEERFEAQLRVGEMRARQGKPWPEVMEAYILAHGLAPTRAEPLHLIAHHYLVEGNWPLVYSFGLGAWKRPAPHSRLFVRPWSYGWAVPDLVSVAAWRVGKWLEGLYATLDALDKDPPETDKARILKNLEYYRGEIAKGVDK